MAQQPVGSSATFPLTRRINLFFTLVTPEAAWPRAFFIIALVDLGIGITQLDGNVPNQLVLETDSLNAGYGFDDGRFSVSDMTDGANVDGGLPCNDLGSQRREGLDIEVFRLRLWR